MALIVKDRVKVTSTTTGTGTYTLGSASAGFQDFSAIGDSNTTFYAATDGTDWEVGVGTYTSSGTTLSRDRIISSSNSNNAVNWGAGDKDVFVTYPSESSIFGGGNATIVINQQLVTDNYTIASGSNGFTVGPYTLGSGAAVTVSSGQRWVVI